MDNHDLLMLERKLEKARQDLISFFTCNHNFYIDLIQLLDKYRDGYFDENKFSIKFSTLFRIMTNRVQSRDLDTRHYSHMEEDVEALKLDYPNEFIEFVGIIKLHVTDRQSLGYNHMYRLIYGEPTWEILKNDIDEVAIEQLINNKIVLEVPKKIIDEMVEDSLSGGDGRFSKTIPYNLVIDGINLQVEAELELEVDKDK